MSVVVAKLRVGLVATQLYMTNLVPVVSPSSSNSSANCLGWRVAFSVATLSLVDMVTPKTSSQNSSGNNATSRSPE